MYKNKKISVIIPCYNEEKTIGKVLKKIPKTISEIIVVDNNSEDKSRQIASSHQGVIVVCEKVQGYGAAIKKGIKISTGDIVAIIDGDDQHYIKDLTKLLDLLGKKKIDLIWGSRFPVKRGEMALSRIFGNKVQTLLFSLLFWKNIKDSQSGMIIFNKRKLLSKINVGLLNNGMSFSEEIKAKALFSGLICSEQKISIKKRQGVSRLNPMLDGIKNIYKITSLFYEIKIKKSL